MANEKKKQTSTEKKKTTQAKTKQTKIENQKNKEVKAEQEKKKKLNQTNKKSVNQKTSNKKVQDSKIKETTNSKKSDVKKEAKETDSTSVKTEKHSKKADHKEVSITKSMKKNENVTPAAIVNSDEMGKLVKIILILVVIVVAFYGLTVVITKFQKPSTPERNKNTVPAVIQYDEILIGTILNQARDEYYVLMQKDDDQYRTLTSYYLQKYSANSKSLKVYMSNINSVYNQFYVSENSNVRTNNMSEFRVSTITLVKIKNHEIVEAYEGLEEVEGAFKKLTDKK